MSAPLFTPGPWEARVSDGQWVVARDRGDVLVAICGLAGNGYITPEADANLIASAPEGFELIEQLEESFTADGTYSQFLPAMRAYLAKVRGNHDC